MLNQTHLDEFAQEVNQLISNLHEEDLRAELKVMEQQFETPNFWDNAEEALILNQKKSKLEQKINEIDKLRIDLQDLQAAHDLGVDDEFEKSFHEARKYFEDLENQTFMDGEFDSHGAILNLHAGAGGIDAMDFVQMLSHMYQAFCKNHGLEFKVLHISSGEEAGLKSASYEIVGQQAYGHLKEEAGVHRLVRLSPFNNAHTRETSFALVEVIPTEIHSKYEAGEIDEKDLKWDYFMSSGKGGQSVNTTYSAVRVTHIPTNISVSCQNERSQLQNKQQAMKYLQDKLTVLELKQRKDLEEELKGVHLSPEWGAQIRNYVLHPYKKIKDVRSGWETNSPADLLEYGELMEVIWSVKRARKKSSQ
jgi:peptide chain release factor 2